MYVIVLGCGDTMFLYCDGELLLLTGSETDGMLLLGRTAVGKVVGLMIGLELGVSLPLADGKTDRVLLLG